MRGGGEGHGFRPAYFQWAVGGVLGRVWGVSTRGADWVLPCALDSGQLAARRCDAGWPGRRMPAFGRVGTRWVQEATDCLQRGVREQCLLKAVDEAPSRQLPTPSHFMSHLLLPRTSRLGHMLRSVLRPWG